MIATASSAWIADRRLLRLRTNIDEFASIVHARYLANGMLGGDSGGLAEGWLIPNMLITDVGWVSQYPPGHLVVLAIGELLGVAWLTGPVLLGVLVYFSSLSAARLLDGRPLEARLGAVLLALSPFMLVMGAGALSHLTAGAAISAGLYTALRARDGSVAWAVPTGLAMGLSVATRPWTGLVLGGVLTVGPWVQQWRESRDPPTSRLIRQVALWVLGGLPAAWFLGWYNTSVFGHPLRFGYVGLYGPSHHLGFHDDPWGYPYGPLTALGYSSADVIRFGGALLETPIPATVVVAATLIAARRLDRGLVMLALWAIVPILANAVYWFHEPRMLFESAPGWIWLAVVGIGMVFRSGPPVFRLATATGVALSFALAMGFFLPVRFASVGWTDEALHHVQVAADSRVGLGGQGGDSAQGSLVFVHTSWVERIVARLQASGMRNDSLQVALRRNDLCALHRYALARSGETRGELLPVDRTLDLEQTTEDRGALDAVGTPWGTRVARIQGVEWTEECAREVASDRAGVVALAPLLWQGDLPGMPTGDNTAHGRLFVRDYGPESNEAVLRMFPERRPMVLVPRAHGEAPTLQPYDSTMRRVWEGAAS
ncbi:hypothetical protein V3331_01260 [Gaopeijia maritima]|uniref:hypothetical protein n=1 Tax=Gaopeijia maritima TaxID=3119007 RepID=UPI00324E23FD